MTIIAIRKMEVIEHEKEKPWFKREGNGTCKATDGRLRKHRRYSGKTEKIVCRNDRANA